MKKQQRGVALLVMLAIILLGVGFMVTKGLPAGNTLATAKRGHNAKVLNEAKRALIGYVAHQAAEAGENNPGRLPCPEAPGNYGTASAGIAAGNCTLPAVGRLPWRTLGLDMRVDAASEPLWYVVSPGWALPSAGAMLLINSNEPPGQIQVDGVANKAVALIIAPGPAFGVPACGASPARSQVRPSTGAPDLRNYLECDNATSPADVSFVTTGPSSAFNDQVVLVTRDDLIPGIEAAIAARIQREIAPVLSSVYAGPEWGLTAAKPLFPFSDTFTNPGTSNYQGQAGAYQGLLPFTYSVGGCGGGAPARCSTGFVKWSGSNPTVTQTGGPGAILTSSCSISGGGTRARCTGTYVGAIQLRMTTRMENVAKALRRFDSSQAMVEFRLVGDPWSQGPATATGSFYNDGSGDARIHVDASTPDLGAPSIQFRITAEQAVVTDHSLLDANDPVTGWFVRNEWYRLIYYAAAEGQTVDGLPGLDCAAAGNCITVNNLVPPDKKRAILILAGSSLTGAARPNGTLSDFLDTSQNRDGNITYEQRVITKRGTPFNDRIIVVSENP